MQQKNINKHLRLISDMKKLFADDSFADLELKASDGKVLKAHKSILATRSPVFCAMLKNDDRSSIYVPDFDSVVIKEVLRSIYYNEVENFDEIDSELILAAEKYQLEGLMEICSELISMTDDADTETIPQPNANLNFDCDEDCEPVLLMSDHLEL